jgi:hypothetical protein
MAVVVNDKVATRCMCVSCPSFPDVGDRGLYCSAGNSPNFVTLRGCNCPACGLFRDDCSCDGYMCLSGPA